jgi:hypothetical protein
MAEAPAMRLHHGPHMAEQSVPGGDHGCGR